MEKKFFRLDEDWYLKAQSSLTNSELRVLLFVTMNVNGFNQSPVNISHSVIGKIIGMKRPHVSSSLKSLIEKNWLKYSQKGYSLKTGVLHRKGTESVHVSDVVLCSNSTESVHFGGTELVPGTESVPCMYGIGTDSGTEYVPMHTYSKKNYFKELKENNNNYFYGVSKNQIDPSWRIEVEKVFKYAWYYWVDKRKGIKTEAKKEFDLILNSNLNDYNFINKFERCYHAYQQSESYPDFAMKFNKWLLEWENWSDVHDFHMRSDKRLKEPGQLWIKIRDLIEKETGEQDAGKPRIEEQPEWKLQKQFGESGTGL